MTTRLINIIAASIIVVAAVFVYHDLFGLWFTDIDTFPLISSGRIGSAESLAEIFTSPLMQGLMANALYYRPLSSISWGIDAAIWGLNPLGYHLTDLALHITNSLLLFFLVRTTALRLSATPSLTGGKARNIYIAAFIAAFIFAIHPVGQEVVPAVARRADLLYGLFLLLTLLSLENFLRTSRVRDIAIATGCALLAFGAKEPALIVPAFAAVFVFCFADARTLNERVVLCLQACVPMGIVAVLYFAARYTVLGGIGGYAEIEGWAHQSFGAALRYGFKPFACAVFMPGNIDNCDTVSRRLLQAALAILLTSFALIGWRSFYSQKNIAAAPLVRFIAFAILALLGIYVLHGITGTPASLRTLYVALLFLSIVMGCGAITLLQGVLARGQIRQTLMVERAIHAIAGIVLIVSTASVFYGAWSGQYIEEWRVRAELEKILMIDFSAGLKALPANSIIYTVNAPYRKKPMWGNTSTWVHPHPMRERPMLLEHSMQGIC